jgi:protein-tyrosine phosphatase
MSYGFEATLIMNFPDGRPFLYLGSVFSAQLSSKILAHQYNIKYIINVTTEEPCYHHKKVKSMRVPLADQRESLLDYLDPAMHELSRIYEQQKGGVLVHCQMGYSRGAAIVIAFLMLKFSKSLKEAFTYVQKRRKIMPNMYYMRDLLMLEDKYLNGIKT